MSIYPDGFVPAGAYSCIETREVLTGKWFTLVHKGGLVSPDELSLISTSEDILRTEAHVAHLLPAEGLTWIRGKFDESHESGRALLVAYALWTETTKKETP